MQDLSESERQELRRVVGEALLSEDEAVQAEIAGDAKEVFCRNWQTVKQVLQFISSYVPGIGKYVRAIIAAGDFLYGTVCRQ